MSEKLQSSAQKVQEALTALGLPCQVVELPASTRTAQEAAQAIGCTVAQIVKSLIFRGTRTGKPILVLASGVNRASTSRVAKALKVESARIATPEEMLEKSGYPCGGTPSFGYPARFLIDEKVMQMEVVYTGGGSEYSLVKICPADLVKANGGEVARVRK